MARDNSLSDAFSRGLDQGMTNKYRKAMVESTVQNRDNMDTNRRAKYELDLRKYEMNKEKQEFDIAIDNLKRVSDMFNVVNDPEGVKFENFMNKPQGQELIKYFKKNLPNQFNENGKLILIENQDLIKEQLGNKKAILEHRLNIVNERLQSGKATPQDEQMAKSLVNEAMGIASFGEDEDLFASAMNMAMEQHKDEWNINKEKQGAWFQESYNFLRDSKIKTLAGGNIQDSQEASQAPQQQPGGFFSKLGGKIDNFSMAGAVGVNQNTQALAQQPPQQAVPQGVVPNQAVKAKVPNYRITR